MFDLGWSELMLVGVIAVLILGPKELPKAMRTMAKWVRKARLLAGDFQRHIDDVVREAELEDLRTEANKLAHQDLGKKIDQAIDPDGSVARGLEFDDRIDPTGPSTSRPAPAKPAPAASTTPPAAPPAASGPAGEAPAATPADGGSTGRREGGA